MKITFEVELDEEKLKNSVVNGGYSLTDQAISQLREDIINRIVSKIDAKNFADEMTSDFARDTYTKIIGLSTEKVQNYLSDKAIEDGVNKNIKWKVDSWIEKNMNEYFTKMRDEFVFMRKEDYDAQLESTNQ